jgi:hypothetical protein
MNLVLTACNLESEYMWEFMLLVELAILKLEMPCEHPTATSVYTNDTEDDDTYARPSCH